MKNIEKMTKQELIAFYVDMTIEQKGSEFALKKCKTLLRQLVDSPYGITCKELRGRIYDEIQYQ